MSAQSMDSYQEAISVVARALIAGFPPRRLDGPGASLAVPQTAIARLDGATKNRIIDRAAELARWQRPAPFTLSAALDYLLSDAESIRKAVR